MINFVMGVFLGLLAGTVIVGLVTTIRRTPIDPQLECLADLHQASRWARNDKAFQSFTKEGKHICYTLQWRKP